MNKIFDISFKRLVVLLLPTFLRQPVIFVLLTSLIRPLLTVYDKFKAARLQNIAKINQTGQVCYLRGLLNDMFDPHERRIVLSNAEHYEYVTFFPETDDQPVFFDTVIFYDTRYIGSESADFVVKVPLALNLITSDELRMKANLNFYRLASKRFVIQYV